MCVYNIYAISQETFNIYNFFKKLIYKSSKIKRKESFTIKKSTNICDFRPKVAFFDSVFLIAYEEVHEMKVVQGTEL